MYPVRMSVSPNLYDVCGKQSLDIILVCLLVYWFV